MSHEADATISVVTRRALSCPPVPGAVNLPAVAVGMLIGGVIMKKAGLTLKTIPRFCVAMLSVSTLLFIPLFFMGCPTQKVSEVNHYQIGQYG